MRREALGANVSCIRFEADGSQLLVISVVQDSSLGRTTRKVEIEDERRNNLLSIVVREPCNFGDFVGTAGHLLSLRYVLRENPRNVTYLKNSTTLD